MKNIYLERTSQSNIWNEWLRTWMDGDMDGWRSGWEKGWSLIEAVAGWEQDDLLLPTYNVLAPVVPGNVGWCNLVYKSLSTE